MTPVTCSCAKCVDMCERSTCLPTPDEARELIRRGYGERLATYEFLGLAPAVGPAPKGQEGARGLLHTKAGCTFLTDDKRCELHALGLKPYEGRIAHHTRDWMDVRRDVLKNWRGKRYESVVVMLERAA